MISLDLEQFIQKASEQPYFFINVIRDDDAGYSLWLAEDPARRPTHAEPYEGQREGIVLGSRRERVRRFKTLDAAVGAMHRNGYLGDIRIAPRLEEQLQEQAGIEQSRQ
jgi:hypothetical protein